MAGGCALIGASTLMWTSGLIGPVTWMILVGLGLYIAYVPFGSMLFDRLFAATGAVGTAGFLIYVTDAFGYLGSVGLLFFIPILNDPRKQSAFDSWSGIMMVKK